LNYKKFGKIYRWSIVFLYTAGHFLLLISYKKINNKALFIEWCNIFYSIKTIISCMCETFVDSREFADHRLTDKRFLKYSRDVETSTRRCSGCWSSSNKRFVTAIYYTFSNWFQILALESQQSCLIARLRIFMQIRIFQ
jgi:hypothetical protein